MRAEQKRLATRAYKERKRAMGIYEVRCTASGQSWVGETRNLESRQGAIWFALRLGGYRNATLQQAWSQYGEEAFTFKELARLSEEETAYPDTALRELRSKWCERLGAQLA